MEGTVYGNKKVVRLKLSREGETEQGDCGKCEQDEVLSSGNISLNAQIAKSIA
jgi:hypothetical protein